MKKVILIFVFLFFQTSFSQQTDFLKIKRYRTAFLEDEVKETSGLDFFNGQLYTFNDSGNSPELFEIDKDSGKVLSILKIKAKNKDWEALTHDDSHFYIGDFGNNTGTRKDLEIYKVPFSNGRMGNDSIRTLSFYYPEQKEFVPKNTNNDFDAEAMIYLNGKLHIFTKEWSAKATSHYTIDPKADELQKAEKIETYKTDFVVTDAAYFDHKLYLVGYTKKTEVFLDIFNETEPGIFFKERLKHYYLGSATSIGQIEGIAVDEKGVYISGEKFRYPLGTVKQSLYFIPKEEFKD
ncbi:hypothetical protein RAH57_19565 [Chryseobacterium sp. CKR4-1]|uniref:hypothetical protein n=1 Tax=Chryseobacterium sp. CKR4-1 TaxID=3068896 RepID=UPI002796DC21|nr:hypothetical protein [Chryseobacterium sp. CKR4-1]MDQ1806192.1 hypothetical protein [Chryseobacterium sp. CKR4-1]